MDSTLESLKGHPAVTGAYWHPSRRSFKVNLKDKKNSLEFTVKNLKATEGVLSDETVHTQLQ